MTARDRAVLATLRHYVYRLFDADDQLLYIGCTRRFPGRLREHMRDKAWAGQIHHWTTTTPYPNLREARLAEAEAIRAESPRHNVANRGVPGWMLATHSDLSADEWLRRLDAVGMTTASP